MYVDKSVIDAETHEMKENKGEVEMEQVEYIASSRRAIQHIRCMGWQDETQHPYKPEVYMEHWVQAEHGCESEEELIRFGERNADTQPPRWEDLKYVGKGIEAVIAHDRLHYVPIKLFRSEQGEYWAEPDDIG